LIPPAAGAPDAWAVGGRGAEALRRDGSRFEVLLSVAAAGGSFAAVARDASRTREWERRVVDAADAVRKEVGQDLHDNVGQQLTGLELMVDALAHGVRGSEGTAGLVTKVAERLRQVHTDLRQLITGIVPAEVPADGLVGALKLLADRVREQSGRACELAAAEGLQVASACTATHLFRIVQEAVSNALRHSRASAIRITVRAGPGELAVEVRDDGGGFSPNTNGTGLGLRLMRDRAAHIGGTLTVTPTGGGTSVTVRLPAAPGYRAQPQGAGPQPYRGESPPGKLNGSERSPGS
jgi:signal transduction histidine kinase